MTDLLIRKGANINAVSLSVCALSHVVDPSQCAQMNASALHIASSNGHATLVRRLLDAGADTRIQDRVRAPAGAGIMGDGAGGANSSGHSAGGSPRHCFNDTECSADGAAECAGGGPRRDRRYKNGAVNTCRSRNWLIHKIFGYSSAETSNPTAGLRRGSRGASDCSSQRRDSGDTSSSGRHKPLTHIHRPMRD